MSRFLLALAAGLACAPAGLALSTTDLLNALDRFDCPVTAEELRVLTRNAGEANLTVMARPALGLSVRIVEG